MDNLLKQGHINYLVALSIYKAQSIVKENFKTLVLVVKNFTGLKVSLSHICFRYICGLVLCHKIEIKHQLVVFTIRW